MLTGAFEGTAKVYVLHTQCDQCGRVRRIAKIALGESTKCPQCGAVYVVKPMSSDHLLRGVEAASRLVEIVEDLGADSSALMPLVDSGADSPRGVNFVQDDATQPYALRTPSAAPDPLGETAAAPHAKRSAEPAAPLQPGSRLGRFEVRAVLGQGGFGVVYRAFDPFLEREVALKVPSDTDPESPRVKRFLREARSAARLKHPNIVAVFEAGDADGKFYIASEYVQGKPLSMRMAEQPPNRDQAVAWVRDLALALAYAHGEGVVHRDIKPGNIILSQHGRPQLTDFGLSKRLDPAGGDSTTSLDGAWTEELARHAIALAAGAPGSAELTADGEVMGTPAYMSPEQARGDHRMVGPASDQFSLAVILYELLCGQRPFVGSPIEVLEQAARCQPTPLRRVRPGIPARLEMICQRAMSRRPEERFADCGEFAVALQQWLKESHQATPFKRAVEPVELHDSGDSLAGLGLLAVGAAIGLTIGCVYNLIDPQLWSGAGLGEIVVGAFTGSIAPLVGVLFGGLLGLAIHWKRA